VIIRFAPSSLPIIFTERVDNGKSHLGEPLVKRRPELFLPPIMLDRASKLPLHRQIHRQIARAIRDCKVPYEARLPSSRVLARILGVSRNTVLAAYDDLVAEGWRAENEALECASPQALR
jgi:hypothetical protein